MLRSQLAGGAPDRQKGLWGRNGEEAGTPRSPPYVSHPGPYLWRCPLPPHTPNYPKSKSGFSCGRHFIFALYLCLQVGCGRQGPASQLLDRLTPIESRPKPPPPSLPTPLSPFEITWVIFWDPSLFLTLQGPRVGGKETAFSIPDLIKYIYPDNLCQHQDAGVMLFHFIVPFVDERVEA